MKHWTIRICLFLVLGAIINVAVAWGAAGIAPLRTDGQPLQRRRASAAEIEMWNRWAAPTLDSQPVFSTILANPGARVHYVAGALEPEITEIRTNEEGRVTGITVTYGPYIPGDIRPRRNFDHALMVQCGWPCRAMVGARLSTDDLRLSLTAAETLLTLKPDPTTTTFRCATMLESHRSGLVEYRVIPLRPIWPGFAINTAFYAFILWLLLAGPFALRRWRRIKRGLCPKCAYPVGTSDVCTECGGAVSPKVVPS